MVLCVLRFPACDCWHHYSFVYPSPLCWLTCCRVTFYCCSWLVFTFLLVAWRGCTCAAVSESLGPHIHLCCCQKVNCASPMGSSSRGAARCPQTCTRAEIGPGQISMKLKGPVCSCSSSIMFLLSFLGCLEFSLLDLSCFQSVPHVVYYN